MVMYLLTQVAHLTMTVEILEVSILRDHVPRLVDPHLPGPQPAP